MAADGIDESSEEVEGGHEQMYVWTNNHNMKIYWKYENKVTTRWEGPQSLSYHKYSLSKDGLL